MTHEVLPAIRKDREYKLRERIASDTREEKSRRLWCFLKEMDVWSYNIRRKHFGTVCRATTQYCYVDEFNAPHVKADCLDECKQCIRETLSRLILDAVPRNQYRLTDLWN